MKVIAISDTHGLHSSIEIPDGGILVHAGDLTHHEALDDVLEFNDFLGRVSIVNWNSCPSSIGFGVHFHRKAHLLRKTILPADGIYSSGYFFKPRICKRTSHTKRGYRL